MEEHLDRSFNNNYITNKELNMAAFRWRDSRTIELLNDFGGYMVSYTNVTAAWMDGGVVHYIQSGVHQTFG